jgi:hypothetical protein
MNPDDRHGAVLRRPWPWLVLVAWLLLNAALLWIYYQPALKPLVGDEFDYNKRALALLAGQPLPELFIWPPGQSGFIAMVYALFGSHVLAVQLIQIVLLALCAGLLARLWRTVDSHRAALFAGGLFLLNPSTLAYAHWLWPEVTHLACLLGALALLLTFNARPRLRAFMAGLLIGLALLFKSLLGGFWPLFFLAFVSRRDRRFSVAWSAAAAFAAGMFLATAPALWKGQAETGHPLIADSSLYNLDVGLRDRSRSDYIDEAGLPALTAFIESAETPQRRNEIYLEKIKAKVAERGLLDVVGEQLGSQYFRLFSAKTLLVSQLPGPACAGHLGVYADSMLTSPLIGLSALTHALTLVLCAFGLALWRRWRMPLAAFCAVYLVYQLALFLGLHVMERYFFQMQPLLCGFGGSFLASLPSRDRADSALAFNRWRLLLGGVLAAILLGLGWLGPVLDGSCQ